MMAACYDIHKTGKCASSVSLYERLLTSGQTIRKFPAPAKLPGSVQMCTVKRGFIRRITSAVTTGQPLIWYLLYVFPLATKRLAFLLMSEVFPDTFGTYI